MSEDTQLFAYRTSAFGGRTRWLLVCEGSHLNVHEIASVSTDAACCLDAGCCLGWVALPLVLLAPLVAWLGEKAIDEKRLHVEALRVEEIVRRDLHEGLRHTVQRAEAPASELFLRRADPSTGAFEIHTSDITEFARGRMVAGADTALEIESTAIAIARLREWMRQHGGLVAEE